MTRRHYFGWGFLIGLSTGWMILLIVLAVAGVLPQ